MTFFFLFQSSFPSSFLPTLYWTSFLFYILVFPFSFRFYLFFLSFTFLSFHNFPFLSFSFLPLLFFPNLFFKLPSFRFIFSLLLSSASIYRHHFWSLFIVPLLQLLYCETCQRYCSLRTMLVLINKSAVWWLGSSSSISRTKNLVFLHIFLAFSDRNIVVFTNKRSRAGEYL